MFIQFDNSTRLQSLTDGLLEISDVDNKINFFYKKYYDLYTADSNGLDWWGQKLGVSRIIEVSGLISNWIGFKGQNLQNFDTSRFFNPNEYNRTKVDDKTYRLMLMLRFLNLYNDGSIATLAATLNKVFPNRGKITVIDRYNMSFDLFLYFNLYAWEKTIVNNRDFLPIPMGVQYNLYIIPNDEIIGFEGQKLKNFDKSRFF